MTREEWKAIKARDARLVTHGDSFVQCDGDRTALLALVRELAEAAGRVRCWRCNGTGNAGNELVGDEDCPDCAPLRELLEAVR